MQSLFNFIFDNFILFFLVGAAYYVYKQYKDLKSKSSTIFDVFNKTLYPYLEEIFKKYKSIADDLKKEYQYNDQLSGEVNRLLAILDKMDSKNINDYVAISNGLNKYKLDKNVDLEKYPKFKELDDISVFDEETMEQLDNGIALARKEYNARAFRYNEKTSSFPIQYLVKPMKLQEQFTIFDVPKSSRYEMNFEVFEEEEPEINSLTSLNYTEEDDDNEKSK